MTGLCPLSISGGGLALGRTSQGQVWNGRSGGKVKFPLKHDAACFPGLFSSCAHTDHLLMLKTEILG